MARYMVQPGDTSQRIAERFGGDSTRWAELIVCNPQKIRARDGDFLSLLEGEIVNLPRSWGHGRASTARNLPSSNEAGDLPELLHRPPADPPMTGSDFVARYAGKSPLTWERAAVELAAQGGLVGWPMVPVEFEENGHTVRFLVSSDYVAIGSPDDYVRLPLMPKAAQRIADVLGLSLPTPKMVHRTWRAARKLRPIPLEPKPADLRQWADHSRRIDQQIAGAQGELFSGSKKDIVISNLVRPGKVVIFGWYSPDLGDAFDNGLPMNDPKRQPIQPHSDAHADDYVDYSHGVRLVRPTVTIDGVERRLVDVLRDPELAPLLSHKGAFSSVRYPLDAPVTGAGGGAADLGRSTLTHPEAAPIIVAAWRKIHGRDPNANERILAQAVASFETGYGRHGQFQAWAREGKFNWGAVRCRPNADGSCPGGCIEGGDKDKDGKPERACFRVFPSDADAAAYFLRVLTKQQWPVLQAMNEQGTAAAVAHAMKGGPAPYYTGPELAYARFLEAHAHAIRATTGDLVAPRPMPKPAPRAPSGGGGLLLAALVAAVALS